MDFKDYYASLGVDKTASEKDIKQAYRRLARKFHPDVNPGDKGAETRFKEINEANEVLGDPDKRKKYDELGANWRMYEQAQQHRGGPGGAGGAGPFGGSYTYDAGGGFRPMSEDEVEEMFGGGAGGGESPFSDFFRTFFGGEAPGGAHGARGVRSRARRGRDLEHELELSLEDALRGTTTRLTVNQGGVARSVDVRIPPGVSDGSRVRVAGEGERGGGSGPSGDLFLRIALRPHPQFERKGRDLYSKVRVPVTTAVLGGEVEVPTLAGKVLRLKVPAGTQNGQVFRLRGHGLPTTGKADEVGDLYATVDVQVPAQVAPEARAHWEALRDLSVKT